MSSHASSMVYFVRGADAIKIGVTTNLKSRLSSLRTSSAVDLTFLGSIDGDARIEQSIHRDLGDYRRNGEWFHDCKEVRDYISNRCGRDIFAPVHEPPVASPEPRVEVDKIIGACLSELGDYQARLKKISDLCIGNGSVNGNPLLKLHVVKRYLVLSALKDAAYRFDSFKNEVISSADLKEIDVDNACRARATIEMLEAQLRLILGVDDASFLDDLEPKQPHNPLFEIEFGNIKYRSGEEASDDGWTHPQHDALRQIAEKTFMSGIASNNQEG